MTYVGGYMQERPLLTHVAVLLNYLYSLPFVNGFNLLHSSFLLYYNTIMLSVVYRL